MAKAFRIVAVTFLMVFSFVLSCTAEDVCLNSIDVYFAKTDIPTLTEGDIVMELYDEQTNTLLDTKLFSLKRGTEAFMITFDVPEFSAGEKFKLVFSDGVKGALHNGIISSEHILETYAMPDENGEMEYYTSFYMSLEPFWNKEAVIKLPGVKNTLFYHCLYENEVYVTTDLLGLLGVKCESTTDGDNKTLMLSSSDGAYTAQFRVGSNTSVIGKEEVILDIPTFEIDSLIYVPLSKVGVYFACNYRLEKEDIYHRAICLTPSYYSEEYKNAEYINGIDIDSKTDYLIWVSKKDYKVNLYTGANGGWRLLDSYPCAIGAPSTPTIEGSFEYHQYQDKWQYDGYYCGPVMRFKGGYALHSVLIKNNGKLYDGRTGVKISHGCVRMLPEDIKWLAKNIPLYTRVLVTE